jgi:RHS repeat-associated protein
LIKDDQKTYTWDAENRLVQIDWINPQPVSVTDNIEMTYDGLGRRVSITEQHGLTVLTAKTFVWCKADLCQERDITGHTITKQFFALGEQINGTNYFYTRDHLGNVREMTDSSGNLHANYDYDTYGRQTKISGDMDSDFGYAHYYVNKTTSLNLTWFRVYDPDKGRWLSRDPLGEGIGPDLYAYVENDSFREVDEFGLCGGGGWGGLLEPLLGGLADAGPKAGDIPVLEPMVNPDTGIPIPSSMDTYPFKSLGKALGMVAPWLAVGGAAWDAYSILNQGVNPTTATEASISVAVDAGAFVVGGLLLPEIAGGIVGAAGAFVVSAGLGLLANGLKNGLDNLLVPQISPSGC